MTWRFPTPLILPLLSIQRNGPSFHLNKGPTRLLLSPLSKNIFHTHPSILSCMVIWTIYLRLSHGSTSGILQPVIYTLSYEVFLSSFSKDPWHIAITRETKDWNYFYSCRLCKYFGNVHLGIWVLSLLLLPSFTFTYMSSNFCKLFVVNTVESIL